MEVLELEKGSATDQQPLYASTVAYGGAVGGGCLEEVGGGGPVVGGGVVVYGISAQGVGGGVAGGRVGRELEGVLGNASSGQSGAVGARVAGPFVWIIQCDTRETKAD